MTLNAKIFKELAIARFGENWVMRAAKFLAVDTRTIYRYAHGDSAIPHSVELAMRYAIEEVEKKGSGDNDGVSEFPS